MRLELRGRSHAGGREFATIYTHIYIYIQWGEQVFDTLPILQVFPLTKHVEVCNFYHRYTSTVKDGI